MRVCISRAVPLGDVPTRDEQVFGRRAVCAANVGDAAGGA
jgi:hypothetical protein